MPVTGRRFGCGVMVAMLWSAGWWQCPAQTIENGYMRLRAAPGHIVTIEWDAEGRRVYRDTRSWLGLWGATRIGQVTGEGQTLRARDAEYVNQEIAAGGFAGPFDYGEDLRATAVSARASKSRRARDVCSACGCF